MALAWLLAPLLRLAGFKFLPFELFEVLIFSLGRLPWAIVRRGSELCRAGSVGCCVEVVKLPLAWPCVSVAAKPPCAKADTVNAAIIAAVVTNILMVTSPWMPPVVPPLPVERCAMELPADSRRG